MRRKLRTYKIILLGDGQVGKTSIRKRYLGEGFEKNYIMTMGADFAIKRLDGKILQIWDLAGQPGFKSIRSEYYKGATGIILVFDLTRRKTFDNIPVWLQEVYTDADKFLPMILIGNKFDLLESNTSKITESEITELCSQLSEVSLLEVKHLQSSALSGFNINELFDHLVNEIENFQSSLKGK